MTSQQTSNIDNIINHTNYNMLDTIPKNCQSRIKPNLGDIYPRKKSVKLCKYGLNII